MAYSTDLYYCTMYNTKHSNKFNLSLTAVKRAAANYRQTLKRKQAYQSINNGK
jgi:hypothetical protein